MKFLSLKQQKLIASLHRKKFRKKHGLFLIEGLKPVESVLHSKSEEIVYLVLTEKYAEEFSEFAGEKFIVLPEKLKKISTLENPEGVLAVANIFAYPNILEKKKLLFLYRVKDPGNLGTVLRIANWFGLGGVVTVGESVDFFNPKVVRASMGSLFNIPFANISESEMRDFLQAHSTRIVLADIQGQDLYKTDLSPYDYLFFGSESHGFSGMNVAGVRKITIPKFGKNTDSLNLAASVSVFAYTWRK